VNAGARSVVQTSTITNNLAADPRFGVGVLLTNADTLGNTAIPPAVPTGAQHYTRIGNNNFSGNGYAIFNANDLNTAVRESAPVQTASPGTNWFGSASGPLVGSPSAGGQEGISGPDSTPAPSFTPSTGTWFANSLKTVPAAPSVVADTPPTVEWGTPSAGNSLIAGEPSELLVLAGDDFGISSVAVTIGGVAQPLMTTAPYVLEYTPPDALIGSTVTLEATATASNGATTTTTLDVPVIAKPVAQPPPDPPAATPVPARKCKKGKRLKGGKCVKKKKRKKK